jgi:Leucine-rich repeat (LRR) protein
MQQAIFCLAEQIKEINMLMVRLAFLGHFLSRRLSETVIVIATCGFMVAPALADVSAGEREALMALYEAMSGDKWKDNTNWGVGDPCDWHGVSCNSTEVALKNADAERGKPKATTGTVIELSLPNNRLHGILPPEIGDLSNLEVLQLGSNELTGKIPPEIGKLHKLTRLHVSGNMLNGPLPASIWDLDKLVKLSICRNPMSNPITSKIAQLTNLKSICLGGGYGENRDQPADLSEGLPEELFQLEHLDNLQVFPSNLSGSIPEGVGSLRNLKSLEIVDASLTGSIPESLANLTALQGLNLRNNQLSGPLPDFLGNLKALQVLFLNGNQLTGEIPENWKDLESLVRLNLDWNALWTLNSELDNFMDQASDSDWDATQTVAPVNIEVTGSDDQSVSLAWDEIEYKYPGHFRVWYAVSSGGPWLDGGATTDQGALEYTVEGLLSGGTYFFTVQTETYPHENNQNQVVSDHSATVSEVTSGEPSVFLINAGLNDAWYYPETDGQGFFINVFPDLGFVSLAWFTYDTEPPAEDAVASLGDAGHRWFTALGRFIENQVVMNITMTSGGLFDTATEIQKTDPTGSDGTITLTFENCNSGTVEYNIPSINKQGIVPIVRVVNDNILLCQILNEELHNSQ